MKFYLILAEIFAFNIDALPDAESTLTAHNMALHSHNIIYRLAEDVRSLVANKLPPVYVEEVVGTRNSPLASEQISRFRVAV